MTKHRGAQLFVVLFLITSSLHNACIKEKKQFIKETDIFSKLIQKKDKSHQKFPMTLLRYLADSNRRRRFCRPLPSHSAKVPLWFASAKVALIFGLTNLYRPFFCSFLLHSLFSYVFHQYKRAFEFHVTDTRFLYRYRIAPFLFSHETNSAPHAALSNRRILQI